MVALRPEARLGDEPHLQKGVDPLTVAILMGHSDPSMLSKVYQHVALNPAHMLHASEASRGIKKTRHPWRVTLQRDMLQPWLRHFLTSGGGSGFSRLDETIQVFFGHAKATSSRSDFHSRKLTALHESVGRRKRTGESLSHLWDF